MAEPSKKNKLRALIDFWNTAFPDHSITEDQFKNPDEASFRHNIILCLNNLHINTACFANIDTETGSRLKSSRCRLVTWTNEVLKIASGNAFKICYMDLLKPKRHCVTACLHYLSNYVAFYREVYKSILTSHQQIKELEDLKTQRNNLKRMIEASKLNRNAESQFSTFKDQAEKLKKELVTLNEEKNNKDFAIDEIRSQIEAISVNVVNDQEAKSILDSLKDVKAQFKEQEEIVISERTRLTEMCQSIERAQSATDKMKTLIETNSIDVTDLKELKAEYESLNVNVVKLKENIAKNNHEIQILKQAFENKKRNIAELSALENEAERVYTQTIKADKNELKTRENTLKAIENKENELYNAQTVVKGEMDLIYNVASNIIKQMSESIFE